MSKSVTTQPRTISVNRKDADNILKNLELEKVSHWSARDVQSLFLDPLGFSYCAERFAHQHITGPALICMTDQHLKELDVFLLGDRILFLEYLDILKKKKKQHERSAVLWKGVTPHVSCAYSSNPCQCLFRKCCPCCIAKIEWRVTNQGLRYNSYHASINVFGKVQREFIDFRFLKDLEVRSKPTCLCCCVGHELIVYADDPSTSEASSQSKEDELIKICHPDALTVEKIVRDAWADARLVD